MTTSLKEEMKVRTAITKQHIDANSLRDRIVNQSFIAISALAIIGMAAAVVRGLYFGFTWPFFVLVLVVVLFVFATAIRQRLSLRWKIFALVACVFTALIVSLSTYGFLSSSKMYIALAPIFISFLVPYRYALASLILFIATYLVVGYLFSVGILSYSIDPFDYVTGSIAWILEGAAILLTAWGLLYVGYNYRKFLDDYTKTIRRQYRQLIEKENLYRTLFDTSNDAILLVKGRDFYDWNSKTLELFQCDEEYLRTADGPKLSPEFQPDGERSVEKVQKYFKKLRVQLRPILLRMNRKHGKLRYNL